MKYLKLIMPIIFSIIALGFLPMFPRALTTETIYATNSNCTFSDSGKYKNVSSNGTISTNSINTTYNGKSYGMQFFFAEDMLTTKVYQLKITFMADDLLPRVNENFIELITYDTSCESDYATILSIEKNTNSGNATTLQINFIPSMTSNKARILIGSSSGPIQITGETTFGIKSVQIGDRESQGNEQIIINNNQNTQNIINNQEQNTQNIIDNQNAIAEQQNENQKVCEIIDKNSIKDNDKYLNSSGVVQNTSGYGITDYYRIGEDTEIKVLERLNANSSACYYGENKNLISCITNSSMLADDLLTIPNGAKYIRFSIYANNNIPRFEICKNGNQAISDSMNDINNSLTDDSPIDISSISNTVGWLPPGPVDAIINLPLNMLNGLLTAFNSTCSPLSVPVPYISQTVAIPCLSTIFAKITGLTSFWSWVGLISSVVILYRYLIALYDYYDHLTTLQANYLSDFGGAP